MPLYLIGHIHWQNDETAEALKAWITVYGIAKKIDLAQALQALDKLAENLDLIGGLDGCEVRARQMEEGKAPGSAQLET